MMLVLALTASFRVSSSHSAQQSQRAAAAKPAGVDGARIIQADHEPENWLSHGRTYSEQRFSPLKAINDKNVNQVALAWYYSLDTRRGQEATPLAVNDERRGFLAAARVQTVIPRQRHLIDILVVDCFERAEALFTVRAAMAQPIFRLMVGLDDAGAVHVCRLCGRRALRLLRRVGTGYAEARRQRENQHHRDSGTSVLSHRFSLQQAGFGCAAGQRHGGGGGRTPVPPARSAYLSPCLFPVKRQFLIPAFRRRESQWRRNGAVHARSNSRRYSASLPIIALTII